MANIKFSQFTVGNTESDIDFVVGYKGANNIQISPTNLLSSTLSGYLPLIGGTMTGTSGIHMPDNFALKAGNSQDLEIFHNGTDSSIRNFEGDLIIRNADADKDISFQADNGSGGITEYFRVDGLNTNVKFSKLAQFLDDVQAMFGNGGDLKMYHNSTTQNGIIENFTNNLVIQNNANDKDIVFKSDDGSGGLAEYFRLDGSAAITVVNKEFRFADSVPLKFGNLPDVEIIHNGTNTLISNETGDLYITNAQDDGDILFRCDNGSGGVAEYFKLDGSEGHTVVSREINFLDNTRATFGANAGGDMRIYHDGTTNIVEASSGNLMLLQHQNDADIQFVCDDGSGGTTEYFRVDGGENRIVYSQNGRHLDNVMSMYGSGADLQIVHDGTLSSITNITGDLYIQNSADNSDIIFRSDDGAGGVAQYFKLDGSLATGSRVYTVFPDNSTAVFGTGFDFQIHHDANNTYIQQGGTGDLYFQQNVDNRDIVFQNDDGSGGLTTYFRLDGSTEQNVVSKNMRFEDNIQAQFGAGTDLRIYHNGSNSFISDTGTGLLVISSNHLQVYNSGITEFLITAEENSAVNLYYDGSKKFETTTDGVNVLGGTVASSTHRLSVGKVGSGIGNQKSILELVENTSGSDMNFGFSFTADGDGSNNLLLRRHQGNTTGAIVMTVNRSDDNVTFAGNLKIQGISEYADNTAAIAAGLTTGQLYRTGDLLKIVH